MKEIYKHCIQKNKYERSSGQAALISVFVVMTMMMSAVFGSTGLALKENAVANENLKSRRSFFAAEAGIDDAVYRLKRNKNVTASFPITLNGATAVTNVASSNKTRTITSSGNSGNAVRGLSAVLSESSDLVQFFYGVQVGDAGLSMDNNSTVDGSVYANGSIIGSNGAVITGDAVVAGGINDEPTNQWTSGSDDYFFATVSTNRDIAQSFTASAGGPLNRVSVCLGKVGSPNTDITIRITTDNGGKPSTSDIASATIKNTSVGVTPSWIDIAFSSPPTLAINTKYWIVLDYGANSSSNHWSWRKDTTDSYAGNTGRFTDDWDSNGATWTNVDGDLLFRAWIGGTMTSIQNVTIGNASSGSGHANQFVGATIHGSACPNQYCVIDNPVRQEMPISSGVMQDWRNDATTGGVCAPPICDSLGNYSLYNGAVGSIGPKKIAGNLTLDNNVTLTITGIVWVVGDVTLSNNCNILLDHSYGALSGIILVDGTVNVSNNCVFQGSGAANSYIMILSAKNAPSSVVMNVSNNSLGVIYYASNGIISFSNNAIAKEATGYGITLSNGATVDYESGLANLNFSSGPSGGWSIDSWQEVAP